MKRVLCSPSPWLGDSVDTSWVCVTGGAAYLYSRTAAAFAGTIQKGPAGVSKGILCIPFTCCIHRKRLQSLPSFSGIFSRSSAALLFWFFVFLKFLSTPVWTCDLKFVSPYVVWFNEMPWIVWGKLRLCQVPLSSIRLLESRMLYTLFFLGRHGAGHL